MKWLDGSIINAMDTNWGKLQEMGVVWVAGDREAWCAAVHAIVKIQTQFGD